MEGNSNNKNETVGQESNANCISKAALAQRERRERERLAKLAQVENEEPRTQRISKAALAQRARRERERLAKNAQISNENFVAATQSTNMISCQRATTNVVTDIANKQKTNQCHNVGVVICEDTTLAAVRIRQEQDKAREKTQTKGKGKAKEFENVPPMIDVDTDRCNVGVVICEERALDAVRVRHEHNKSGETTHTKGKGKAKEIENGPPMV
ncbi:hypothetical protein Dimus_039028 [Dionaea muscipula]